MSETALEEVERFKVGFANDHTGATHKYLIVDETISGRYVVRGFFVMQGLWGKSYLAETEFELKGKSEVTNIHFETLEGERI